MYMYFVSLSLLFCRGCLNIVQQTVLKSLVVTAGSVLRKAQLYDEAIHRRKQTEALLQITELMSAELGTEKVMKRIIEASYALVDAERITLFSVNRHTRQSKKIV